MSRSKNKVIAISMGDPCGVGPEVLAAALGKISAGKGVEFIVVGNEDVLAYYWPKKVPMPLVVHVAEKAQTRHKPGQSTSDAGVDSLRYLEYAVKLLKEGKADGLVTAPVSKEAVIPFCPGFRGHTTFLAEAFGSKHVEMLFIADDLRVVLVTRHVPITEISALITSEKVKSVVETTAAFVRERFGIARPRVAVCGLNPHAGEGGHMGREEITRITPALNQLRKAGWDIVGPLPADTLFEPRIRSGYDLIAAMYHDQALTALKAQYFERLVNLTVGLPFIRTSPAHGTAFGIAGKGVADPGSMLAALKLAMELV
jgi:4-hydroxythreonine-4-phosphate dehydrogenase